jgi:Ca2+-binding RTX toxin-like protein
VIGDVYSQALWIVRLTAVLAFLAMAAEAYNLTSRAAHRMAERPARVQIVRTAAATPVVAPARASSAHASLAGSVRNDAIVGARGSDTVRAGAGNDTVVTTDGARDFVDCGGGIDTVTADRVDVARNCEHVTINEV